MGSQSVTNFSVARQKNIGKLIKDYYAPNPEARPRPSEIGAAAIGALGKEPEKAKGPRNQFLQALSSDSVAAAIELIMSLTAEMKRAKDVERVYEEHRVDPETERPLTELSACLLSELKGKLSATQRETDFAFAAEDAITQTIIDVVAQAFPGIREPVEVDRQELAEAFKKVKREKIGTTFIENVASALINLVLDATRGPISQARMGELKQKVREEYVPELIERIKRGE